MKIIYFILAAIQELRLYFITIILGAGFIIASIEQHSLLLFLIGAAMAIVLPAIVESC